MATDLDQPIEVTKEVELDGKSDLHLITCENGEEKDLTKFNVASDCNGIVHDEEVKDSGDLSYVMVENPVSESREEESALQEMNLNSEIEEKKDQVEVETEYDAAQVSTEGQIEEAADIANDLTAEGEDKLGSDAVVIEESREPIIDENGIADSKFNPPDGKEVVEEESKLSQVVEHVESDSQQLSNGEGKDEEQAKLYCQAESKGSQELDSQIDVIDSVEAELNQAEDRDNKVEEISKLAESEEAEDDSQIEVIDSVEAELNQPEDRDNKVEEMIKLAESEEAEDDSQIEVIDSVEAELNQPEDRDNKVEEMSKLAESEEAEDDQGSPVQVVEAAGSESESEAQLVNSEMEIELQSLPEVSQDTQIAATETMETEQYQHGDGEEQEHETGKLADEISADRTCSHPPRESLSSDVSSCPLHDQQVEIKGADGPDDIQDLSTSVEQTIPEIEVIEKTSQGQERSPNGEVKSEPSKVNGHVENTKLSSFAVELNEEMDVVVPAANGDGLSTSPIPCVDLEPEVVKVSVERDENISTCSVDDVKSEAGLDTGSVEGNQNIPAIPDHDVEREIVATNGFTESTKLSAGIVDDAAKSDSLNSNGPIVNSECKLDCVDDVKGTGNEGEQSATSIGEIKSDCNDIENEGDTSVKLEDNNDLKGENEGDPAIVVHSDIKGIECEGDVVASFHGESKLDSNNIKILVHEGETIVANGENKAELVVDEESKLDSKSMEDVGDQSISGDNISKPICQGDGIEGVDSNGSTSLSPEDSVDGALEGKRMDSDMEKRPFRFLIRIPRYFDDKIKSQIELAQKQVDDRTRDRDDIRSTIQSRRGTCGEHRDKFEACRSEERTARDALNSKRREMDSIQLVINRKKSATSIEDIHDRIRNMEHRIEHETVPLKEEKQLIREIKQLKHLRDQLSSSLGQQVELQPASDNGIEIESRFKLLKQEIDSRRKEVLRLEGITRAAWKLYSDENEKLKELQAQFRAADDRRQEAYTQLQNLKKQFYEKNKYFRMYKDDARKAEDYAFARDREALQRLCVNQVESMMELWNTNDEFRNEYVRCNAYSTLRRLRTLDGRSLGPDEEPPLLRNVVDGRVDRSVPAPAPANRDDFPSLSASERRKSTEQVAGPVEDLEPKKPKADSKSVVSLEQKYPTNKSKTITKPSALENSHVMVSAREEKQENDEEIRRIMEEKELARKADELQKEKEAAKLKEQRRVEEKAKAKEAEERKRRNAEKAQARAQLRAQKEAELKEKEREKRARKKNLKKEKIEATGADDAESVSKAENTQTATMEETEVQEKPKTASVKRLQKPSLLAKQIKPKVIPPPLRNRGKKRMQQWMWILFAVVMIVALFLVGNIGFSGKFGFSSLGF